MESLSSNHSLSATPSTCQDLLVSMMPYLVEKRLKQDLLDASQLIGGDVARCRCLIAAIEQHEQPIRSRLAWVLQLAVEKWPEMLQGQDLVRLAGLMKNTQDDAEIRAVLNLFRMCPIPEEIQGELYEQTLKWAMNPKKSIAIRVYSVYLMGKLAQLHPELVRETLMTLDEMEKCDLTPAVYVSIRNTRAALTNGSQFPS